MCKPRFRLFHSMPPKSFYPGHNEWLVTRKYCGKFGLHPPIFVAGVVDEVLRCVHGDKRLFPAVGHCNKRFHYKPVQTALLIVSPLCSW
jgi:hypothetical protein